MDNLAIDGYFGSSLPLLLVALAFDGLRFLTVQGRTLLLGDAVTC